jgi:PAT family beta-lactamase induction signal transducer AmpG
MGLSGMPLGFTFGFISTAFGILLTARGVPVGRVLAISAIAFSPSFWAWALCPLLDVHFTRKQYAYALALLTALLMTATVLLLGHLGWFTVTLTAACTSAVMYGNATGGIFADTLAETEYDTIGGWNNVANLGAAGAFSGIVVLAVNRLSLPAAAVLLGVIVWLPSLLLLGFPAVARPAGDLRENFAAMVRDVRRVLRQGRVWVTLAIFLSTASCFALTNAFSSLGQDFHASEATTTWLNGPGVAIVCSLGCLLAIPLAKRWNRRGVYLASGAVASLVVICGAFLPHTVVVFAVVLLAYNMLQGFNYTVFSALTLETTGARNALAATMVAVLTASGNLPISVMSAWEGRVHDRFGVRGMFLLDAAMSLAAAALLLGVILPWLDRRVRRESAVVVSQPA